MLESGQTIRETARDYEQMARDIKRGVEGNGGSEEIDKHVKDVRNNVVYLIDWQNPNSLNGRETRDLEKFRLSAESISEDGTVSGALESEMEFFKWLLIEAQQLTGLDAGNVRFVDDLPPDRSGQYDPVTDEILLDSALKGDRENCLHVLIHELWHCAYRRNGGKGILHRDHEEALTEMATADSLGTQTKTYGAEIRSTKNEIIRYSNQTHGQVIELFRKGDDEKLMQVFQMAANS